MRLFPIPACAAALLWCLCAVPPGSAAQGAQEAFSLRLRWIPGNTYTQETTTETLTGQATPGQAPQQKMKVKQITEVKVTEVRGQREARVTFRSLAGEVMLQGQKHVFDSANLENAHPVIKASVGQSVGKSFVMVYSDDYQFVEVRDSSPMVPPNEEGQPSLTGIAEAKEVADLYRRSLEMGLPKTAVKPGDRWTSQETVKFPSAGTVNVELRANFEVMMDYEGRRHAKIVFEGDMSRADDTAGTRTVTLGNGSKVSGQVLFDIDRGTVSASTFRADIKLEVGAVSVPVKQLVTTKLVNVEG